MWQLRIAAAGRRHLPLLNCCAAVVEVSGIGGSGELRDRTGKEQLDTVHERMAVVFLNAGC